MFKKLFFSAALVSSILASNAWAQKSASKSKDLPVTKEVAGSIGWTGYGVGKSHTGTIQVKSGKVEMKNENVLGGTITFDMTTLATGDSKKLESHLKSADFFEIEKYPEAQFVITKVEKLATVAADGSTHKITGNLTIKNKTQPIDVMSKITFENNQWKAVGSAEIKDRTQHDIVYNSKKFTALSKLGDKMIEDNIKVTFDLATK